VSLSYLWRNGRDSIRIVIDRLLSASLFEKLLKSLTILRPRFASLFMLLILAILSVSIPSDLQDLVTRARASTKHARAVTEDAWVAGDYDLSTLKFTLALSLFGVDSNEIQGVASDGRHIALIPHPKRLAFFERPAVFANGTEQKMYHLRRKVMSDKEVVVYKVKELQLTDVFSEITMGTFLKGNRTVAPLGDGASFGMKCTGAANAGVPGDCAAFVAFAWDTDTPDPMNSRPEKRMLNSISWALLGFYAEACLSVLVKLSSLRDFNVEIKLTGDAVAGAGFRISAGVNEWEGFEIVPLRIRIPLELVLGFPTSFSIAGIGLGFNIYVVGNARISRVAVTLPVPLEYYRELRAHLGVFGQVSSAIKNYVAFGWEKPEFSTMCDSDFPEDWVDVINQGVSVSFSPAIRLGLGFQVMLGPVEIEPQGGLEVGTDITFTTATQTCGFPFLKAEMAFYIGWWYKFDPFEIFDSLIEALCGKWASKVKSVLSAAWGLLKKLLDALDWWPLNAALKWIIDAVNWLSDNSEKTNRIWTSPSVGGCMSGIAKLWHGATAHLLAEKVTPAFLSYPVNSTATTKNLLELGINLSGDFTRLGSATSGGVTARPFIASPVSPDAEWQYRIEDFWAGQTVTLPDPPVPIVGGPKSLRVGDVTLNTKQYLGRIVDIGKEFTLSLLDDQDSDFYALNPVSVVAGEEYALITHASTYAVPAEAYFGIDTAASGLSEIESLRKGSYRLKHPASLAFHSVTQVMSEVGLAATVQVLRCPFGSTSITASCFLLDTFDINLPDKEAHSGAELQTPTIDFDLDHEGRYGAIAVRFVTTSSGTYDNLAQSDPSYEDGVVLNLKGFFIVQLEVGATRVTPGFVVDQSVEPESGTGMIVRYFKAPLLDVSQDFSPEVRVRMPAGEIYGVLQFPTTVKDSVAPAQFAAVLSFVEGTPLLTYETVAAHVYIVNIQPTPINGTYSFLIPFRRHSTAAVNAVAKLIVVFQSESG
jgi:hypothetical protein